MAIRILLLITLLMLTTSVWAAKRALVVGNAAYKLEPLGNPVNDARGVATDLEALGFQVTVKTDVSQREFDDAVDAFSRQIEAEDIALFFYSGHAVQATVQARRRNYLIPLGADIDTARDLRYRAIDVSWIMDRLNEAGPSLNIVILDACRNNPYRERFKGGGDKGLARIDAPGGTLLAYATRPDDVAADGDGPHSPYTTALREYLGKPGLSLTETFNQVSLAVSERTAGKQVPEMVSSRLPPFCFAGCEASLPPLASAPPRAETLVPGKVFRDRPGAPEMVVIPAGEFWMGSPEGEAGRLNNERRHQVRVEAFAIGRYEVTKGEFRAFVEATGYKTDAEEKDGCYGWDGKSWTLDKRFSWRGVGFTQGDDHPVVCVSWNDAVAYAEWLSAQTGEAYRLPTEAEWEYAARAGTQTARYWGEDADEGCGYENVGDLTFKEAELGGSVANCRDSHLYTAPVGTFRANGFGLHDVLGNVWEWTCSEYDGNYSGVEKFCVSKNRADNGAYLVLRGGAWNFAPVRVRAADRGGNARALRNGVAGFRLARSL